MPERYFCPTVRAQSWEQAQAQINNRLQLLTRMLNQVGTGPNIPSSRLAQGTKIEGIEEGADVTGDHEAANVADGSLTVAKYLELRNTYVFSDQDSLDASYPFEIDFEIISEMLAIESVKLSFRIREFRAYATTVPSGGGHTTPSGGGHTTPSGGGDTSGSQGAASGGGSTSGAQGSASGGGSTSGNGGATTPTSSSNTHGHSVTTANQNASHHHQIQVTTTGAGVHALSYEDVAHTTHAAQAGYMTTGNQTASHAHVVSISGGGAHTHTVTIGNHTHTTPNHTHPNHTHSTPAHTHPGHTHTTPAHTHAVSDHQHTVSNHTHSLTFGIYEDSQSPTIHYHIDNGSGYGSASGDLTTDQLDIDITSSISGAGFKRIKFDADVRCRLSAWVLCKVDLTS